MFPPDQHEEIWAVQRTLDFPGTLWGLSRSDEGRAAGETQQIVARRYRDLFGRHIDDRLIDPST
jgi:hypothetical protein